MTAVRTVCFLSKSLVGRAGRRTVIYRDVTYYVYCVLYFRVSRPGPKVHTLGGHEKLCISVCTLVQCLACKVKNAGKKYPRARASWNVTCMLVCRAQLQNLSAVFSLEDDPQTQIVRNQSEKLFALLVQNVESRKAVRKEIFLVTIRMYSYAKVFSCPHADMTMTALVHGWLLAVHWWLLC